MKIVVKERDVEIQVGNHVGRIYNSSNGEFKFVIDRINSIHIGSKRSSVVCKGCSYDLEELIKNTRIAQEGKMVLINEPFIATNSYAQHCREIVKIWNEKGVEW